MLRPDHFLSFEGRLDRARWILGAGLLLALVLATHAATWWLDRGGNLTAGAREGARVFVQAAVLVPWLTLDWKRFQDLGQPGRLAVVCPALFVLSHLLDLPALADLPGRGPVALALSWLQALVALVLALTLPILPGTQGPNRFGPDPREAPPDPQGSPS